MRDGTRRENAGQQAERTASLIFLGARAGQLLFSSLMYANDRGRYVRPRAQLGVLLGVGAESAWLARRLLSARRYDDRVGSWTDTATAAGALLASHHWLGDQPVAPWAKNVAIGSAIGAAAAPSKREATGAVAVLCAAALATGLRPRGRDAHVAGAALAVNDAISWAGVHVATRVYLRAHRRAAQARDRADELTVERARAAAAEDERTRQHELLHQVTIDVLARISECADPSTASAIAGAEAARLRFALRSGGRVARGLDAVLADLAQEAGTEGLAVELVTAELAEVAHPDTVAALGEAVRVALHAARHDGAATRAVVRAVTTDDAIELTVRDHGRGFDPSAEGAYAQSLRPVAAALEGGAGSCTVWSSPGSGVRLTLRMPRPDLPGPAARFPPFPAQRPDSGHSPDVTFDGLAAADARDADRTLLAGLLTWRVTGLATGAVALVAGRDRHRNRLAAVGQLAVAVADSGWFAARVLGRDRWADPVASGVDTFAAVAVLALGHRNLAPADRSTWLNWAPWSFAANVVSGLAMGVPDRAPAMLGAATVIGVQARPGPTVGDALANSTALAGFFAVARSFAGQLRAGAVALENARRESVDEGRRLSEARERGAQLRLLHDHALQTLETVAAGRYADLAEARERAGEEAARLAREVRQRDEPAASLRAALEATVAHHSPALHVELDCAPADELEPTVRQAFASATGEALTNVAKHARSGRASVLVTIADGRVTVTIADQGAGFDPRADHGGFGMNQSIRARMYEAGGSAETHSRPGQGTRVVLRWPA